MKTNNDVLVSPKGKPVIVKLKKKFSMESNQTQGESDERNIKQPDVALHEHSSSGGRSYSNR